MAARDKKLVEDAEEIENVETSDDDDDSSAATTPQQSDNDNEERAPVVETEEEEKQFWSDDKMPEKDEDDDDEPVTEADTEPLEETPAQSDLVTPDDEENPELEQDDQEDMHQSASMHDDAPPQELHGITEASSGGNNMLKVGAMVVAALAILGGGFWFYQSNQGNTSEVAGDSTEIVEETAPTPVPTAAPVEEVDFAEFKVQILNGSGTPGEAGKVQEMLKEEGFEEFTTGNAKSYTYKETEVSVKAGTPDEVVDHVKETLGENYSVTDGDELDADSEYDVVVIVGSKEAS